MIETYHMPPGELDRLATGLFRRWEQRDHTFWLDSGCVVERLGRFSFLGTDPAALILYDGERTRLTWPQGGREWDGDPLAALADVARPLLQAPELHDEVPFTGGLVGYLTYDLGLRLAGVRSRHIAGGGFPLLLFGLYDTLVCLDHRDGLLHLISCSHAMGGSTGRAKERLLWLRREVEAVRAQSAGPVPAFHPAHVNWREEIDGSGARLIGDFTRTAYLQAVERIQGVIRRGPLQQVNLSQRFRTETRLSGGDLYWRLRGASPAPFGAALRTGGRWILSASPERLFSVRRSEVETRPIKGTRPRSDDPDLDTALRHDLTQHPKDRAEHLMIVELAQEELGAVCDVDTVHVPELMQVESYRTVHQLVSTVRGRLLPHKDAVDCLRALFPGASITGRPKRQAMEVIDAAEPVARGVYTGTIGYLGLGGAADFNVAIRTIVLADGVATFHVGGAIVAASQPAAEYEETLDKAEGLVQAILAEGAPR